MNQLRRFHARRWLVKSGVTYVQGFLPSGDLIWTTSPLLAFVWDTKAGARADCLSTARGFVVSRDIEVAAYYRECGEDLPLDLPL